MAALRSPALAVDSAWRSVPLASVRSCCGLAAKAAAVHSMVIVKVMSPAQTSCATNAVIGADNVPVDIAPGGQACYVISITPTAPLAPTDWTYFALDDLPYAGRQISVLWDKTGRRYGLGAGLHILADGKKIASSSEAGGVKMWDVTTGKVTQTLAEAENKKIFGLFVSPDGKLLVTASGDTTVRLWDLDPDDDNVAPRPIEPNPDRTPRERFRERE